MKTGIEKHLLHIENLSYHYENDEPVLRNINIDVNHGESIGVIGTNGVGKSTLLKLLVGLLLDYDGTLEVVNHPMVRENVNHIREYRICISGLGQSAFHDYSSGGCGFWPY